MTACASRSSRTSPGSAAMSISIRAPATPLLPRLRQRHRRHGARPGRLRHALWRADAAVANGFFGGPQLVRGFAPNGFGPRDLTPGTTADNSATAATGRRPPSCSRRSPGCRPTSRSRRRCFPTPAASGAIADRPRSRRLSQSLNVANSRQIRASIGAGLIWDSPFGPLRVDYAYPVAKTNYDVTQRLRFGFGPF